MPSAIPFLRKYGHLDTGEQPQFTDIVEVESPSRWTSDPEFYDAHFSTRRAWFRRSSYEADFARFSPDRSILIIDFPPEVLSDLPRRGVVVDIGSSMGRTTTRPCARSRPDALLFFVDMLSLDAILADHDQFKSFPSPLAEEELKTRYGSNGNTPTSVTDLLRGNGFDNITYVEKTLRPGRLRLGIEEKIEGKPVYVVGFKNCKGLGNLTAQIGVKLGAEKIAISNSAPERIRPDSEMFNFLRNYVRGKMSSAEFERYKELLYDPSPEGDFRYDYRDTGQRIFGKALKYLFVEAQKDFLECHGYRVEILAVKPIVERAVGNFNQPDFYLLAKKR